MDVLNEIPEAYLSNMAYMNIINRTSVRQFKDMPLTSDQVSAILHAAVCAPSGVNKQPWEVVVVENINLREQLAKALPYAKMASEAPVVILMCGNKDRFLKGEDSVLWEQDLSAASENLLLAANAIGLGGVWTCLYPHADRMDAVRKILNLEDNLVPFNLIPVGYPREKREPMDKWHPERIHIPSCC